MFIYYISIRTGVYLVSLPVHGCFGLPDDEEDPKKPEIDWCKRSKWGRKEMMHFFLALRVSTSIQKPTFHTPLISMTINRLLFLASYLFLVRNSAYFFRQITTFIKVCVAFVFGLPTLLLIDFSKVFQLKGLKSKNKSHTNFYDCCDLTKKVYLM